MNINYDDLKKMIDHSLLHPTMSDNELKEGCELALQYDVASVCIKPFAVKSANIILSGSNVKVGTVVGFPHGNSSIEVKAIEADKVCSDGAEEVDMVINIGKVLSEDWKYIHNEIEIVNSTVLKHNAILKVIFENDFLDNKHIIKLCKICNEIKPAFVKTSTGYGFVKQDNGMYSYKGATNEHLKLMRKHSIPGIQVKAAGGIRTLDDLLRVKSIGVTRIGATATKLILEAAKQFI